MNPKLKDEGADRLFGAILQLETIEECYAFFEDIGTISEIKAFVQRFDVARMLTEHKTYKEIHEKTGASEATSAVSAGRFTMVPTDTCWPCGVSAWKNPRRHNPPPASRSFTGHSPAFTGHSPVIHRHFRHSQFHRQLVCTPAKLTEYEDRRQST